MKSLDGLKHKAFQRVKNVLQSVSPMVNFDENKEVILTCDASPYGLGQLEKEASALIFVNIY